MTDWTALLLQTASQARAAKLWAMANTIFDSMGAHLHQIPFTSARAKAALDG